MKWKKSSIQAKFKFTHKIQQFKHKLQESSEQSIAPLLWDEIVNNSFDKELNFALPIEKVVYNTAKNTRAVILHRNDGTYSITYQHLFSFDDDGIIYYDTNGSVHWQEAISCQSIVDTVQKAEKEIENIFINIDYMRKNNVL